MDDWNDFLESEKDREESVPKTPISPIGSSQAVPLDIPPESASDKSLPKEKTSFFWKALLSAFSFQCILCLCIVILMILLNTFFPKYYSSIDQSLKNEFARIVYMKQDAQQVIGHVSSFLEEIRPSASESSQPVSETENSSSVASSSVSSNPNADQSTVSQNSENSIAGGTN